MMISVEDVPKPKTFGPLGHLPLIDKEQPTLSLCKLAEEYGPIYRLEIPGYTSLVISGHELVADVCDVSRFDKQIYSELENVRAFGGDGLFTSRTTELNWQKAHNILLPTFSKQAMKDYHSMMTDIATQLIQKWERLNPMEEIDVPEDMTRLTLDTIGLCGFNYRFNSFYRETHSPFIMSMVRALNEAMLKSSRLKIQNLMMVGTRRQFNEDIETMFSLVDKIIEERKTRGMQEEIDLLGRMLNVKDPDTGETLSDENIRYQIITFLIAGHETTSGLLSFALYFLIKHPEVLEKAYKEVDQVLTEETPTYEQILQLKYIRLILNESLRLWPTAPGFELYAKEDTVIGDKYLIKKGDNISVLLPQLHRDKNAWGENVEQFYPERFEDPQNIPTHAFKPFGNGQRACIGMQFALHEATLVLAMILQRFELIDYDNYQLKIQQTLTIKPGDFKIRVKQRNRVINQKTTVAPQRLEKMHTLPKLSVENAKMSLLILYGSDLGTAERVAKQLADESILYGIHSEVASLDEYAGKLPKEGAVLIVCSSYNGHPPRNARKFLAWLENSNENSLQGVNYAVFGCGDRNWHYTYQKVPRTIDQQLAIKGATRILLHGEADASADFEKQLEHWREQLWQTMKETFDLTIDDNMLQEQAKLSIQVVKGLETVPLALKHGACYASIIKNEELQSANSKRSTRHIEIALPKGLSYQEGDHLGVVPKNSSKLIHRVLRRFKLNANDQLLISFNGNGSHLPTDDYPVSLYEVLATSVELQETASRIQIRELAAYTECPPHKRELEQLLQEDIYREQVLKKRLSMLELLEMYDACELPFEKFIALLPPLKVRYYSISSSPMENPERLSITVGVLQEAAWSGRGDYHGVASNYLSQCQPGESLVIFIRSADSGFLLPEDASTSIIMVGPGTGIAPFRGFLQARAAMKQRGISLGQAHLFFGCRNDADFIYREELEQFEKDGIVTLHTAFSRKDGIQKAYVQQLMVPYASNIIEMLNNNGRLYVCGDGNYMAPAVEAMLQYAYQSEKGVEEKKAKAWLEQHQYRGNYVKDVWVQNG
ncbi:bifunctional cytochrome P450/NADPH--P450 reductase [Lysinibacillus sp. NPDC047702]|uniref:bifunctional cytochrome P450/NADPH--P450 reductase n=1 Tax=unclassified Lysinibacillus TaxID=2636778 RepID=UPI003D073066